jgi:hypothetical protein
MEAMEATSNGYACDARALESIPSEQEEGAG